MTLIDPRDIGRSPEPPAEGDVFDEMPFDELWDLINDGDAKDLACQYVSDNLVVDVAGTLCGAMKMNAPANFQVSPGGFRSWLEKRADKLAEMARVEQQGAYEGALKR